MTSIPTSTTAALLASQARVAKAADTIAKSGAGIGTSDLNEELVSVEQAKNDFQANATILKVEKQLNKTLLDILA